MKKTIIITICVMFLAACSNEPTFNDRWNGILINSLEKIEKMKTSEQVDSIVNYTITALDTLSKNWETDLKKLEKENPKEYKSIQEKVMKDFSSYAKAVEKKKASLKKTKK